MKIVFCGGGTGGHITPALAMADILRQKHKDAAFLFIGREGGGENAAIVKEGHRLLTLDVRGLKRSLSLSNFTVLSKAIRARSEAKMILRREMPDAVIGTGGYVCWPVLSAARSLGIKTAIHESNAYPGAVSRYFAHKCNTVMLGYPEAEGALHGKCHVVVTGNPVRSRVGTIPRGYARARLGISESDFVILSFGGSLGASRLNTEIAELIKNYSSVTEGVVHIHATGRAEFEEYATLAAGNASCRILPYIEDMPLYLAAADIGITRCGAMTLAEICTAGLPSILIPSPNVTANHQYKNALALSQLGGAIVIEEAVLSAESLEWEIVGLRSGKGRLQSMRNKLHQRNGRNAEVIILRTIEALLSGEK